MKLWIFALVAMLFISAAPQPAAAVDLCQAYGICLPPTSQCEVNALVVRVCDGQVLLCSARYMGGGGPTPLHNFVWDCRAIMA